MFSGAVGIFLCLYSLDKVVVLKIPLCVLAVKTIIIKTYKELKHDIFSDTLQTQFIDVETRAINCLH